MRASSRARRRARRVARARTARAPRVAKRRRRGVALSARPNPRDRLVWANSAVSFWVVSVCDVRLMVDRRSVCGAVPAPRRASVTTRDGTTARAARDARDRADDDAGRRRCARCGRARRVRADERRARDGEGGGRVARAGRAETRRAGVGGVPARVLAHDVERDEVLVPADADGGAGEGGERRRDDDVGRRRRDAATSARGVRERSDGRDRDGRRRWR